MTIGHEGMRKSLWFNTWYIVAHLTMKQAVCPSVGVAKLNKRPSHLPHTRTIMIIHYTKYV